MAKRETKRAVNVRLNRNGKILNFSTKASAPLAGYTDADVFEKAGVIAVCGTHRDSYHLCGEGGRPRKALSNAQLVAYLCEKFGCGLGACLPAWIGQEENVLFFGGVQSGNGPWFLDESFTPVEVEYNRRVGNWAYVHDNWIEFTREVREALPERLSAYRCGRVVLLSGDTAGKLVLTPRRQSGNQMLVSRAVADQLRSLYGGVETGMRLHAAILPGGVVLADSLEALGSVNLTRTEKMVLDESKYSFLSLTPKGSLYLSAPAWEQMEGLEQVEVYGAPGCLALRPVVEGGLRVTACGYAHHIHSKKLHQMIAAQWPAEKKLYLLRYGNLWLLWPNAARPAGVPAQETFQRIELNAALAVQKQPQHSRVELLWPGNACGRSASAGDGSSQIWGR